MGKLNRYFKTVNLDCILAIMAGILAGLILKGRMEKLIYSVMLSFSPAVPDIFMPGFYPDMICVAAGGFGGFAIHWLYNKKSTRVLKIASIAVVILIILVNAAFLFHTAYISYQLNRPIESLDSKDKFVPVSIEISSEDKLTIANEYASRSRARRLLLKENNPYIKAIYEDIQNLKNKKVNNGYRNSDYVVWIHYDNNKSYTDRVIWLGKECGHERLVGIHDVEYDGSRMYERMPEIMDEYRNFDKSVKEYFSVEWYDNASDKNSKLEDIHNTGLLFDAMSMDQNYNPDEGEGEFYGRFFSGHTITPEDGDLVAVFYSLESEQYKYNDAALYDRSKKLLIFKDKSNLTKCVQYNLDELFRR